MTWALLGEHLTPVICLTGDFLDWLLDGWAARRRAPA